LSETSTERVSGLDASVAPPKLSNLAAVVLTATSDVSLTCTFATPSSPLY
jgi:hypothetical protein